MLIKPIHGSPDRLSQRSKFWNHKWPLESRFTEIYGNLGLDRILDASRNHPGFPVPIVGTMCFAADGMLVPYIGGAGFSSIDALVYEASVNAKQQIIQVAKFGVTGVTNVTNTLWYEGNVPPAGALGAALAAGANCTRTTAGAIGPQANAAGSDTLHLVGATMAPSVGNNLLVLYDRLWHGAPTMNIGTTQTITHTLPRYATTTSPGNFAFPEIQTVLPATAHNLVLVYTDQDGNTAQTAATLTGVSSGIAKRLDFTAGQAMYAWPLLAGDNGFRDLESYQHTSALASGAINVVAGHIISLIPQPVTAQPIVLDGINSAFSLIKIEADACLALLEAAKGATSATSYTGMLTLVSGNR